MYIALCTVPYALCPVPCALCPVPFIHHGLHGLTPINYGYALNPVLFALSPALPTEAFFDHHNEVKVVAEIGALSARLRSVPHAYTH